MSPPRSLSRAPSSAAGVAEAGSEAPAPAGRSKARGRASAGPKARGRASTGRGRASAGGGKGRAAATGRKGASVAPAKKAAPSNGKTLLSSGQTMLELLTEHPEGLTQETLADLGGARVEGFSVKAGVAWLKRHGHALAKDGDKLVLGS